MRAENSVCGGYLSAYEAETGKLIWRTYTVPGDPAKGFESKALEAAAKTWHGPILGRGGGGTIWDSIVYDPDLDLVYGRHRATGAHGTAIYAAPGGGDNLYLASILAFRASDGQLVWHYQVTPQENWDYGLHPATYARPDLNIAGRPRKVIMQASEERILLRARSPKPASLFQQNLFFDGVTWATGIDPQSGRPIESASRIRRAQPGPCFPRTPVARITGIPWPSTPPQDWSTCRARQGSFALHVPDKGWISNTTNWNRGEDAAYHGPLLAKYNAAPPMTGLLLAWDPAQQHEVWRVSLPQVESGGVLATAANLIFQGRSDGVLCAYRATDGKQLWQFDAGTGIMAPPVTYLLDGVQYVTIMVGWGGSAGLNNIPAAE